MQVALVERARAGDEEAFASLARAAGDRLLAIAYRILRDLGLAEDAVQQTLVLAWRELPSLRDVDRFDAWVHRLLVNACYAEARRGGFRRLPAEQRAIFVFHHYLGLTLPEVADHLGVPLGTVKSRLHYATNTLRAALEADLRTSTDTSREHLA